VEGRRSQGRSGGRAANQQYFGSRASHDLSALDGGEVKSGDVWLHRESVGRTPLQVGGDGVARSGQRKDQNGERAHVAKHQKVSLVR
jgi:hypothetical protein